MVAEVWSPYQQDALRILRHTTIASFSAKWEGSKKIITKGLCDYKGYKPTGASLAIDDRAITQDIWDLENEADIVIAQNGDTFDIKKINARFLFHGLKPPSPFKTIDTLKILHSSFAFDSNKLDVIGKQLGFGGKVHTEGYSLWVGCMEGDKKAWKQMKKYNENDVILLEESYKKLRAYAKTHPLMGMYGNIDACPKCGVSALQSRGFTTTKVGRFQRYQCTNCGSWGRDTNNVQELKPIINI